MCSHCRVLPIVLAVAITCVSLSAFADLQNVVVGGSIHIRGNLYTGPGTPDKDTVLRYPATPGRFEVDSPFFGWNKKANDLKWVEERTKINVRADFTDNVSAFIELDSYDIWGEDFRSNYLTGIDSRSSAGTSPTFWGADGDVEVYQAYIEAREIFGTPLKARIGRQELKFGSGFLIAPQETAAIFTGTSFDAVRLTYATDQFSVDGFWAKLAEGSPLQEDGDVDLYGVYASYLGIKDITLDAYWFFLRDAAPPTTFGVGSDYIPAVLAANGSPVTNLHTVGLRGNGKVGPVDFEAEVAYQFGDAESAGISFAGAGNLSALGPKDPKFDNFGANLEVGYNIDMAWTPRVFIGGAYLGGNDNRGPHGFGDWLDAQVNPYYRPDASVSFNRMFSSWEYSEFIENSDLSNAWVARCGVSVLPVENLKIALLGSHFSTLDAFKAPTCLPFVTKSNDTDLGWEAEIIATYNYTKDLSFEVGYAHLFVNDGLGQGNFSAGNGLIFNGGTAKDDADYVYFDTKLTF